MEVKPNSVVMSTIDPQRKVLVVTVSDRCYTGERADATGPHIVTELVQQGWSADNWLIPDGVQHVTTALQRAVAQGYAVVLTTGGTGISPRDQTPEGTRAVVHRELPGLAAELVRRGVDSVPTAVLSRAVVGIVDNHSQPGTFVANLPGSMGGVRDGLGVILPLLPHIVDQIAGGDHP